MATLGSSKLHNFFLREFEAEEQAGFARLSRVPDSHVASKLDYYRVLNDEDRQSFRDCCAHLASANYGFVVGAGPIDRIQHPFFERWSAAGRSNFSNMQRNVPLLRAVVQQYKIDASRGRRSHITDEEFAFASSIRSIKAPELRKRVRAALKPLGYYKTDELGYCRCCIGSKEFLVDVDYGGRNAQLRYCVAIPEFVDVHPLSQFCFERSLGFGLGDWNYITEENVEDVTELFVEVVRYCLELPDRIRSAAR